MLLDEVANRYAKTLFIQRFDELAKRHQQELSDLHHKLLVDRPQPTTIHDVFYYSETIRLGVDFIASVVDARIEGLLVAYKRARVPIDDEAVRRITRDGLEWFNSQSKHLVDKVHREAEHGNLPTNDRRYLDVTLQGRLASIPSDLALKLSQLRDEHLLDTRTAAKVETVVTPKPSRDVRRREWMSPPVIVAIIAIITATLVGIFPNDIRSYFVGLYKSSLHRAPVTSKATDTLREYEPFGELRESEYSDDSSLGSKDKAVRKVEKRLKDYPDDALAKEADEFCRNLTRLAIQWNQNDKDAGPDLMKQLANVPPNLIDYSQHYWPEVKALQAELIARTPARSVEGVNIKFSHGASLSDKATLSEAGDVDPVRQYLQALKDAFVTSRNN